MARQKYSFNSHKKGRNSSLDSKENSSRTFPSLEIFLVIISLVTYLADTLTDIMVSIQYFRDEQWMWAALTITLVLVPSIIIQIFSARWYAADGKMKGCCAWMVHILQLQPLERYLYVIVAGVEARGSRKEEALDEYYFRQNDACMLRLFEAFLESAPQLTLQLYIMLCTNHSSWLIVSSACVSLLALGWAVAAYSHALRQAYRETYTVHWPGLVLQTVWHISLAAARVLSLVAFASVFKGWLFVVLGVHWCIMTTWVVLQNTDFCPTKVEEYFFDAVVGIIYCFCFFNLKEGHTRYRMAAYYTLMLAENLILVGVWFPYRTLDAWYNYALLSMVVGCFALGIICMLVYYRFCHPSGPIFCCPQDDYPAYAVKGYAEGFKEEDLEKYTFYGAQFPETPERMGAKTQSKMSVRPSKASLAPRYTSTGQLPRRALLKQITQTNIEFKEVGFDQSQLSPIKMVGTPGAASEHVFADCTIELDESLQFQHYTVNASACFQQSSRCNTLAYSGVNMSRAGHLDSADAGCSVGSDPCRRHSRELKLERMRHVIQSTPLYSQHPRYRIYREKFSAGPDGRLLGGRLPFSDVSDAGKDDEREYDDIIALASPVGEVYSPIGEVYSPIGEVYTPVGDALSSAQGASPVTDSSGSDSTTPAKPTYDSGHCTDASSGCDGHVSKPPSKSSNTDKKSPTADKLSLHPSIDSLHERETALIRDTATM